MIIINDEKPFAEGAIGLLYMGRIIDDDTNERTDVAIKQLAFSRDQQLGQPTKEALTEQFRETSQLQCRLRHKNLIHAITFSKVKGRDSLVMEFTQLGTLLDRMYPDHRQKGKVEGPGESLALIEALDMLQQVARGLSYLHNYAAPEPTIHSDIHPGNIFYGSDGLIKVGDFGLAGRAVYDPRLRTMVSMPPMTHNIFGSPELDSAGSEKQPLRRNSDLWSLYLSFYYALTGAPIYDGQAPIRRRLGASQAEQQLVLDEIKDNLRKRFASDHPSCKDSGSANRKKVVDELVDMVVPALSPSPVERPFRTASDLVDHLRRLRRQADSCLGEILNVLDENARDQEKIQALRTEASTSGSPRVVDTINLLQQITPVLDHVFEQRRVPWDYESSAASIRGYERWYRCRR